MLLLASWLSCVSYDKFTRDAEIEESTDLETTQDFVCLFEQTMHKDLRGFTTASPPGRGERDSTHRYLTTQ
jgi:hypothetical protein